MRWEYKTWETEVRNSRLDLEGGGYSDSPDLNKLGAEGWEMCGCFPRTKIETGSCWVVFVFKRSQ